MCACVILTRPPLCALRLPTGHFQVQSLSWHCSGNSLILMGKDQLCLCYLETEVEK